MLDRPAPTGDLRRRAGPVGPAWPRWPPAPLVRRTAPFGPPDEPPTRARGRPIRRWAAPGRAALSPYWTLRGPLSEGQHWLDRLLLAAGPEAAPEVRARPSWGPGLLARARPDWERARARLEEGLVRGPRPGPAPACRGQLASALGGVLYDLGQMTAGGP